MTEQKAHCARHESYDTYCINCLDADNKARGLQLPYPWCMQPGICDGRSYCPRDPNCGD